MSEPKRMFFHNGTKYIMTGNQTLADSHFHELRAHLGSMKRTNVNNLPILTGAKEFDDGTVATFQLIHGREMVSVFAPSMVKRPEVIEIPRQTIDEDFMIVPCFRSSDNQWFVASLGGTFAGPYYAFKNIYDIPAEAFKDNLESDLNNQPISVGSAPIEDSDDDPVLFFVAQTAIRPILGELDGVWWVGYDDFNNGTREYTFTDVSIPSEPPLPPGGIGTVSYDYSVAKNHLLWGEQLNMPPREFTYFYEYEGWGTGGTGIGTRVTEVYDYTIQTPLAIRAERDDISNFACCYLEWRIQNSAEVQINIPSPKTYFLKVGQLLFEILKIDEWTYGNALWPYEAGGSDGLWRDRTPKEMVTMEGDRFNDGDEGIPDGSMLKYYGPESQAPVTALFCGVIRTSNPVMDGIYFIESTADECARFEYHYVGPNTKEKDGISTTTFIPEDPTKFEHIIPGIDDTVKFKGEVFLGKIAYETVRKLSNRLR